MRDDQRIRVVGIVCATVGYSVRTFIVGNGTIPFLGYELSAFGLLMIAVILMAAPETVEMFPWGPSRKS